MKLARRLIALLMILTLVFAIGCSSKEELKVLIPDIDFTLEDEQGNPIKMSDQNGKVRLLTFLYTQCKTTCVATTHYMTKVQEALIAEGIWDKDIHFYTISFDPKRDTGEQMLAYAEKWGMDLNHWSLVRGSEEDTRQVALDFGVFVQQVEEEFIHGDYAILVDKKGQVRQFYTGSKMDVPAVVEDIKSLR